MNQNTKINHYTKILPVINENYEEVINYIKIDFNISLDIARKLFNHLLIYTHGIATMIANKVYDFDDEIIEEMISEIFIILYKKYIGE